MGISLRQLLDMRLGGFRDNAALLSAVGGGMLANPAISTAIGDIASRGLGVGLSACGGALLADRVADVFERRVFESAIHINSDVEHALEDAAQVDGILLGYTVDGGRPVVVSWDDWMRHVFIVGQSGVGKTVLGEWVMFQQIVKGGGMLWIDGKLDAKNVQKLNAMCAWAGRRQDLEIINPGVPEMSDTYNPILYGDPDEVADRALSLIPSAENNPGADYFRQASKQGMTTLIGAIQATGMAYNFGDIALLLQNDKALEYLQSLIPRQREEWLHFALFLEQYKTPDRNGQIRLDLKKLRDTFGGFGGRMHTFGTGNFGKITSSYTPGVNLFKSVTQNKITYLALPTMGKPEAASNFGKMAIGDFRTVVSQVQALPESQRPWPPYLGFFDEAGSYVTQAWSRIFEQSRSARLVMAPAIQTMANLEAIGEELREMVLGNTQIKIAFRLGTYDTAEQFANLFGTERVARLSVSMGKSGGLSGTAGTGHAQSLSRGVSAAYSESQEEVHRVSINDLRGLEKGECIVQIAGRHTYHVKIPQIEFSKAFLSQVGDVQINRSRPKWTPGLNMFRNAEKWI